MRAAERRVAAIARTIAAMPFPDGVTATAEGGRVTLAGVALRERAVTDPALAAIGWGAVR
ncbi:MAG: hypothetical protein PGN09_12730 [Sphingomonas fennica]